MVCRFFRMPSEIMDLNPGVIVHHIVRTGETISSHAYENRVGGKGANQAIAIVRAGGNVQFYGMIGKDGIWIRDSMLKCGIDVAGIIVSDVNAFIFKKKVFLMIIIIIIRNPQVVLLFK
jgi:sugar/nucleoside kinase (ribokinase family)